MKLSLTLGLAFAEIKDFYDVGFYGCPIGRIWLARDRDPAGQSWEWLISLPMTLPESSKGTAASRDDAMAALGSEFGRIIASTPGPRLQRAFEFALELESKSPSRATTAPRGQRPISAVLADLRNALPKQPPQEPAYQPGTLLAPTPASEAPREPGDDRAVHRAGEVNSSEGLAGTPVQPLEVAHTDAMPVAAPQDGQRAPSVSLSVGPEPKAPVPETPPAELQAGIGKAAPLSHPTADLAQQVPTKSMPKRAIKLSLSPMVASKGATAASSVSTQPSAKNPTSDKPSLAVAGSASALPAVGATPLNVTPAPTLIKNLVAASREGPLPSPKAPTVASTQPQNLPPRVPASITANVKGQMKGAKYVVRRQAARPAAVLPNPAGQTAAPATGSALSQAQTQEQAVGGQSDAPPAQTPTRLVENTPAPDRAVDNSTQTSPVVSPSPALGEPRKPANPDPEVQAAERFAPSTRDAEILSDIEKLLARHA